VVVVGREAEAARERDAALALAEEIGYPPTRGTALMFAAPLAVDAREPERVRAYTASLPRTPSTSPGPRKSPPTLSTVR